MSSTTSNIYLQIRHVQRPEKNMLIVRAVMPESNTPVLNLKPATFKFTHILTSAKLSFLRCNMGAVT